MPYSAQEQLKKVVDAETEQKMLLKDVIIMVDSISYKHFL